jgi:hypothetical protein
MRCGTRDGRTLSTRRRLDPRLLVVQSGRLGGGQRDTRWRVVASVSVVDRPTPAKDCLPGSVAGARRVLGSRRDRPAGESWAPSPPTDRQAVTWEPSLATSGSGCRGFKDRCNGPRPGLSPHPSRQRLVAHLPPPARAPPRSQPRSSCGPRPARAGRSGDAARRRASDPGRLKAPHARPRLSRRASGAAGSLRGRARGGSRRSTVAREEREQGARPSPRPTASSPSSSRTRCKSRGGWFAR